MPAVIISANLPTLRPALHLIARLLVVDGSVMEEQMGQGPKPRTGVTEPSQTVEGTAAIIQRSNNSNRLSFYHLPDDSDSVSVQTRMDAVFRPSYDRAKTYTNVKGQKVSGRRSDEDQIPLSEIKVDKEFTQTTTG
ncbi:hypothetical protein N7460_007379 [Penicillium canescens]|uniref:Uncharacterized protein n=1 Tax=Penicillium canescens TaxID=5083 RepID=A0AAD6I9Y2_PENCN|nr:hypothetical protein N7460_007379 [Penicillium canescens]KAJ6059942.1 hypothetical protein N7444_002874 [Penicillium canescens]